MLILTGSVFLYRKLTFRLSSGTLSLARHKEVCSPSLEAAHDKPKCCFHEVQLGEPMSLLALLTELGEASLARVTAATRHWTDSPQRAWGLPIVG